jgi:hypothetical protein
VAITSVEGPLARASWLGPSRAALAASVLACAAPAKAAEVEARAVGETAGAALAVAANMASVVLIPLVLGPFPPPLSVEYGSSVTVRVRGHMAAVGSGAVRGPFNALAGEEGPDATQGIAIGAIGETPTLLGSFGGGFGVRWYPGSHLREGGAHLGFFGEYLSVRLKDRFHVTSRTPVYLLGAEAGYRWVFKAFFIGPGLELGYAVPREGTCTPPDGPTCIVTPTPDVHELRSWCGGPWLRLLAGVGPSCVMGLGWPVALWPAVSLPRCWLARKTRSRCERGARARCRTSGERAAWNWQCARRPEGV